MYDEIVEIGRGKTRTKQSRPEKDDKQASSSGSDSEGSTKGDGAGKSVGKRIVIVGGGKSAQECVHLSS